jgi:hypothetical protein
LFWYKHVGQPVYVNEEGIRIYYPQPYFIRVIDTASGSSTLQTASLDYNPINSAQSSAMMRSRQALRA